MSICEGIFSMLKKALSLLLLFSNRIWRFNLCRKVDYTSMGFSYILLVIFNAMVLTVSWFLLMIISIIGGILLDVTNEPIDITSSEFATIALSVFGFFITCLTIALPLRQKKYDGETGMLRILKYNVFNYTIYLVATFVFFFLTIISFYTKKISTNSVSFSLMLFSFLMIVKSLNIVFKTDAKIYYISNKTDEMLVQSDRKKWNYYHYKKHNKGEKEFFDNLSKVYIKYNLFVEYGKLLDRINSVIYYEKGNELSFEEELFKLYTKKFFRFINNDSQFVITSLFNSKIISILESSLAKKDYYHFWWFLNEYSNALYNFMRSKKIRRRLILPKIKTKKIIIQENCEIVKSILERNVLICGVFNLWIKKIKGIFETKKKSIEKIMKKEDRDFFDGLFTKMEKIIEKYMKTYNDFLK